MPLRQRVHPGHHTLVPRVARQAGELRIVAFHQVGPGSAGALQEMAHAGIAPGRVEMQLAQGLRCNLQADGDGMKAEQEMGGHAGALF